MKEIPKTLVHMYLPQHKDVDYCRLYKLFKKRVMTKSEHNYVDLSQNPVILILNINHPICSFQEGVIVKYKSFKIIYDSTDTVEIGFSAIVYSGFSNDTYIIYVYKIGKAFLEKQNK